MSTPDPLDLEATFRGADCLITGGLGFIGSNLARRLVELGAKVTLLDSMIPDYGGNLFNVDDVKDRVTINIADVRDRTAMDHLIQGRKYLFNLAGQVSHIDSMRDPFTDLEINCRAQLSILESCRHNNRDVKVVFASSRQIYGRPRYLPVDEKHPLVPVDVNGINKMAGERYHLLYSEVHGVRATSLRLTNTYGPRQLVKHDRQGFIATFVRRAVEGGEIALFGDGTQTRDLNFVDDVVEAFLLAAASGKSTGEIYNLAGERPVTLKSIADSLIRLAGKGSVRVVPFPQDRQAIDIGAYHGSAEKIRADLGWRPRTSLEDGLARTVQFYAQHLGHYS